MRNRNGGWWAAMFYNAVCVVGWIVLAIVFRKWWVALFACLMTMGYRTRVSTEKDAEEE